MAKSRQRTDPTENQIQADYFSWLGHQSRNFPIFELAFHIPNGSYKSFTARRIFQAIGLKAGVPDVFLPVASNGHHGLWIEFKTKTGRVSDAQKAWLERLEAQNYRVIVCRSWWEAANATLEYLGHPPQFNDKGEQTK